MLKRQIMSVNKKHIENTTRNNFDFNIVIFNFSYNRFP
ncbi:hypothetical protein B4127_1499 [Bacillus pumilus]|uniref:Uncharacterized protein n=1 Tax=Bacillus pumilus TaxID=1408 RepID=A0AB34QQC3_BACPU|nr:hypothetical protein B4127_1499 [Bacillus pumilus]